MNLCIFRQFLFNNNVKTKQWGKNSLLNKLYGDHWISTGKKSKLKID